MNHIRLTSTKLWLARIKLALVICLLPFFGLKAMAEGDIWAQHYAAGRDLLLRTQCMDGLCEKRGSVHSQLAPVNDFAATQMDKAVVEFKAALEGLPKHDELFEIKKVLTLGSLKDAQSLSHHPEDAKSTESALSNAQAAQYARPYTDLLNQRFKVMDDEPEQRTCPVCHKRDGVVPVQYGLILRAPVDQVHPKELDEKLQAKLQQRRFGGCVIRDSGPVLFCNRCDIEFLGYVPKTKRQKKTSAL